MKQSKRSKVAGWVVVQFDSRCKCKSMSPFDAPLTGSTQHPVCREQPVTGQDGASTKADTGATVQWVMNGGVQLNFDIFDFFSEAELRS